MIDLDFAVESVEIGRNSAVPLLFFKLRISSARPEIPVEAVLLQAQIRIAATHRDYGPRERERLVELFGPGEEWERTLRDLMWTQAGASVPAFAGACTVALPVPCSYDLTIAATRYFYGLQDGEAPLLLLFSGTIFFRNADGDLQIGHIAHHKEAGYRLPVRVWQDMMDRYYPDAVWLRLSRDLFEEVYRTKRRKGLASWEEALRLMLARSRAEAGG